MLRKSSSIRPRDKNLEPQYIKSENKIHYRCSNPDFEFIFEKLIERYY